MSSVNKPSGYATDPSSSPEEPSTFEAAMDRLEDSVSRLESGELSLEGSLEIFERGIAASRACTRLLNETRKRVQVLIEEAGGDLRLEFLDADEEGDIEGRGGT